VVHPVAKELTPMSVTVDDRPLAAEDLGLKTIGQLLSHIQKENRLIVHVLIDGEEPDLNRLTVLKQSPLRGHTLYIETTEPRRMALEVLGAVETQLAEADRLTNDAVEQLRAGQHVRAMEKLRGCFSTWQHAQESLLKIAQLLRIDLARIFVDGRPFSDVLAEFTAQLKLIKQSLENRDFVSLVDTLVYETAETSDHWRAAIRSMRTVIE
jgi:hypothetical protein